jgi:hypothetical protein
MNICPGLVLKLGVFAAWRETIPDPEKDICTQSMS